MRHGELLQKILKEKNMKVSELSRISGISAQTLYGIIRRNNLCTDKKTLVTISKALNISFSVWTLSEEELTLKNIYGVTDGETVVLSKESFLLSLELYQRNFRDIATILNCIGMTSYTSEVLENIVNNHIAISKKDGKIIEYVLTNNQLISWSELKSVIDFRELSTENRNLIENIINKIVTADKAEKQELDEWIENMNKNS